MPVTITPLPGLTFGSVIADVDVLDLDDADWRAIHDTWHQRGIVVLKGQSLDVEQQKAFAQRFGELELQSGTTMRDDLLGQPIVLDISNVDADGNHITHRDHPQTRYLGGNEDWHSDSSFKSVSAKASVLHALETPSVGGHTGYADARAGYDELSEEERARFEGLRAYHSLVYAQARVKATDDDVPEDPTAMEGAWHPMVRTHPVTGRKNLFIGRHAALVEGLTVDESRALLDELAARVCSGPRVYYHPWEPGDVVVWDNRCMLHRATEWDLGERRVLRHVRVAGEVAEHAPAG